MSPDCRFHSERFSGPGCSSSPFGEVPKLPNVFWMIWRDRYKDTGAAAGRRACNDNHKPDRKEYYD
jgi:hypothetical protein